tara:strand:- start:77 stop:409 length:333 start_codon:yes stop_codon:yes gene_type:complete
MNNNELQKNIDKARISIYNILAILIVIIPELFAELIYSIEVSQHNNKLPKDGKAWENNAELKLSRMTIYELRLIARKLSIHGYSNENRNRLIRRLKRKLKKGNSWESLNI